MNFVVDVLDVQLRSPHSKNWQNHDIMLVADFELSLGYEKVICKMDVSKECLALFTGCADEFLSRPIIVDGT